jgi:folylpolyglutamate synthase/dihydrofolate synthase
MKLPFPLRRLDSHQFHTATRPATQNALEWLEKFKNHERTGIPPRAGTDASSSSPFDLGRMHRLLEDLENPHFDSWRAIHIAGTKGKGSTATMLSEIFSAAGLKVATYTSPHVLSLHERIRIGGEPITPPALDQLVQRYGSIVEAAQQREGGKLTHFEILTALAYRHFADSKVDVGVIETGVGGTSDATNVLPPPSLAASVITSIGNDHSAVLGGSLESIVEAKFGIVKADKPLVVSQQHDPSVAQIVDQYTLSRYDSSLVWRVAEEIKVVDMDVGIEPKNHCRHQRVTFELSDRVKNALQLNKPVLEVGMRLVGKHQADNAATAITATAATASNLLGGNNRMQEDAMKILSGLERAWLPGRFDVRVLPAREGNHICVLDGSHTPESATALTDTLRTLFPLNEQWTVSIVLAMAADKDVHGICAALSKTKPAAVIFSQVAVGGGNTRSAPPGMLIAAWQAASDAHHRCRLMIKASMSAAISAAIREVQGAPSKKGVVLVTGSLHAVGAALKETDYFVE